MGRNSSSPGVMFSNMLIVGGFVLFFGILIFAVIMRKKNGVLGLKKHGITILWIITILSVLVMVSGCSSTSKQFSNDKFSFSYLINGQ